MTTIDQEIIREEELKNILDSVNLETQSRYLPKRAVEVFSEEVLALLNSEEIQLEPKMACSRFPNEFKRKSKRENGWNKVHKRRKLVDSKVIITGAPHYDGYQWRKYGQKAISSSNHPRTYYRCTHKEDQGCLARKQVQQQNKMSSCGDSPTFQVIYENEHSCTSTKTDDQYIFSCTNDTDYDNTRSNFILFDNSKRSTYLNNDNILQDQHTCINHKMFKLLNESKCRVEIEEDNDGSGYLGEVINFTMSSSLLPIYDYGSDCFHGIDCILSSVI